VDLLATVLRPVYFMGNLEANREDIQNGTLALPLNRGVRLQMLDVADYGAIAARVLTEPNKRIGETIKVAGDEQTLDSMTATFTDVLDTNVEAVHVPLDDAREQQPEDLIVMYEWFNEEGYTADIDTLETEFNHQFHSLATYLRNHEWHR
jgi:uncharacterized protein YbjT (DUF2867 family)